MFNTIHLFWYSLGRTDGKENYGDALGPFIISKISGKKIVRATNLRSKKYLYFIKHYFTVGSIIKRAKNHSIVWGSGLIKKDEIINNAKFLAVRGPITRARLLELGYKVPEKYGDPSILLPTFIKNYNKQKYKFGIIPHYSDYALFENMFINDDKVKIFDLLTDDVERTTNEICECEYIFSSSLHGLIVPHAYKIPALWIRFSNSLSGDDSKFYDYFESVGLSYPKGINVNTDSLDHKMLEQLSVMNFNLMLPNYDVLQQRINDLMETCPF